MVVTSFAPKRAGSARFERCPAQPSVASRRRGGGQTATELRRRPCRGGSEVTLWKLAGAGHVWPGAKETPASRARLGPETTLVSATAEMWRFFERHPLPG